MDDQSTTDGREAVELEEVSPSRRARAGTEAQESVLSEEAQARAIASRLGIECVDLTEFTIVPELFRNIPVELMFRYNFVPLRREGARLVIVVSDPSDVLMIDELEVLLGMPIEVAVGTKTAINEILKKSESSQRVLEEATEEFKITVISEDEDGEETLNIDKLTSDTSPIIKLVDSTVFNALNRRASDIHIETREREVVIKYRIDGVLYQAMEPIDKRFHSTIISRIKVMSELDISEKRVPQDGRFKLKVKGRTIDFRVSIMPSVHGEDAVIRILDKESANEEFKKLSLDVVGFAERDLKRLRRFITEPYGMVLVTGPTGSGETTTVHANNVVDVLGRFLNMKVEPYNFVSALNCVLAQRLVRLICHSCNRPVEISKQLLEESALDPSVYGQYTYYEGRGCIDCNGTGFRGRTAIE